ncbi:hypothetical protein V1498_11980 [Peribacillus sp. SCS-26]|uniref:hypothetical protein n=1 Tax=Paraperibacillus marinus TaxID=3115295 RepID=UPI003905E67E
MLVHKSFLKLLREKDIKLTEKFEYDVKGETIKLSMVEILDSFTSRFEEDTAELARMYEEWPKEDIMDSIRRLGFRKWFDDMVGKENGSQLNKILFLAVTQKECRLRIKTSEGDEEWVLSYDEEGMKLTSPHTTVKTHDLTEIMLEFAAVMDSISGPDEPGEYERNPFWKSS